MISNCCNSVILNKYEEDNIVLKNERYFLAVKKLDNNGDLSFGAKVAKMLLSFGVPKENIVISTGHEKQLELFNKARCTVVNDQDVYSPKNQYGSSIVVVVPRGLDSYEKYQLPIIAFNEYGYPRKNRSDEPSCMERSFGINKQENELGILIDRKLWKASQVNDAKSPEYRAQILDDLSPTLQQAILDQGGIEPAEFFKTRELHLLYAQDYTMNLQANFILGLDQVIDEMKEEIVVLIPGSAQQADTLKEVMASQMRSLRNIKEIQFFKYSQTCGVFRLGGTLPPIQLDTTGRNVKLRVICGLLPHRDMKKVLLAVDWALTTGDQSLTEAISADAHWIYQARKHKIERNSSHTPPSFVGGT